jgi:putative transposase
MPRIPRGSGDNLIYHVLNRGNGRQVVFHKDGDYAAFIDLMKEAKERCPVKLFAYCLMPTHFHMVVMADRGEELSRWMQWLMTSHVRRYHSHHGGDGHVWQGRFKSFIVEKDEHLLMVLRYVEGNPVRANLVHSAKEWRWSSHRERIEKDSSGFLDDLPVELPPDWGRYVDSPLTESEVEKLRESVNRQCPSGAPGWQVRIASELGLESTMRPRGRPKGERRG